VPKLFMEIQNYDRWKDAAKASKSRLLQGVKKLKKMQPILKVHHNYRGKKERNESWLFLQWIICRFQSFGGTTDFDLPEKQTLFSIVVNRSAGLRLFDQSCFF